MALLRFLSIVSLSVWVGGLAALAMAAPVLFGALEAHDAIGGRELAGATFGAVFRQFQSAAWVCGGLLLALFAARAALGPRPRRMALRVWIAAGMLAISVGTAAIVIPRVNRLRSESPGPIAALSPDDPRRARFTQLHGLSNALMVLTVAAGLTLLWFETTDAA